MPGIQQWQYIYIHELAGIYEPAEANTIAQWVLEDIMQLNHTSLIIHALQQPNAFQEVRLYDILERLKRHEPLQYILGYTWFCGYQFHVNPHVLIPRRETEELVMRVANEYRSKQPVIIDIGTGSGCIAISLAKQIAGCKVFAADISEDALKTAKGNAEILNAPVTFLRLDILSEIAGEKLPMMDILVSNPPYIPQQENYTMKPQVTEFEPHQALFVPDDDPLLFYRALGKMGRKKLLPGGALYAEIHEDYGQQVADLWLSQGYSAARIIRDMQGKERIVHASN